MAAMNAFLEQIEAQIGEHATRRDEHLAAAEAQGQLMKQLAVAHEELLRVSRERAEAVQRRWRLRRAFRELRQAVADAKPAKVAGKAQAAWPLDRKRIERDLLLRLRNAAVPMTPGLGGAGVYVLFDGEAVSYVGQAVRVGERVSQHIGQKRFQRAAFVPCHPDALDKLERLLIDALLPRDNRDSRTLKLKREESTVRFSLETEHRRRRRCAACEPIRSSTC